MVRRVRIALYASVAAISSACGTTDDNRPPEAQYVTAAILAPACGAAECHSTFAQTNGYVFDTLVGMRKTIVDHKLVQLDSLQFDPAAPQRSNLVRWLTEIDPLGRGKGRMPQDAPLANEDIHFIERWITGFTDEQDQGTTCTTTTPCAAGQACKYTSGSATGECFIITYTSPARGAQCNPKSAGGLACIDTALYQCGADWNVSTKIRDCANGCEGGVCQ
ncbi:hypothetical protein BH11MYX1_BH11MYX1_11300 [soil metagenome]